MIIIKIIEIDGCIFSKNCMWVDRSVEVKWGWNKNKAQNKFHEIGRKRYKTQDNEAELKMIEIHLNIINTQRQTS